VTDVHSPGQRSRNMAAIRSTNTKPELQLRSALFLLGYRYRLHGDLPGRPDIVLPRYGTVIFVHGCFWHMHNCRYGRVAPRTRSHFWSVKREANKARDARQRRALRRSGWRVLTVWECKMRDPNGAALVAAQIDRALRSGSAGATPLRRRQPLAGRTG